MPDRPKAVIVVSSFLFLATAISLLTGTALVFPGPRWNSLWDLNRTAYIAFAKLGILAGILLLVLGVVTASAATGLLLRRRWAWWIATSIFAINGLGDALTLVMKRDLTKGISGIIIALAFLFCLSRPNVRRYFGGAGTH